MGNEKHIIGLVILCLVIGVTAIIDPDATDKYFSGGHVGYQKLIVFLWGRVFGFIAVVIGIVFLVGLFITNPKVIPTLGKFVKAIIRKLMNHKRGQVIYCFHRQGFIEFSL